MGNFCGKCGSEIDVSTGLCPKCSVEQAMPVHEVNVSSAPINEGNSNAIPVITESIEKPKKERSKGWMKVITVLLSICLLFVASAAAGLYSVRTAFSANNVEKMIASMDFEDYLDALAEESGVELDELLAELSRESGAEIDEDDLEDFIEKSTIKSFIAEKVGEFYNGFFVGEVELTIKKKEMKNMLNDNVDAMEDEFDVQIKKSDVDKKVDAIFGDKNEIVLVHEKNMEDELPNVYVVFKGIFSYTTIAILGVLSAFIIFLMFKNNWYQAIGGIAVDMIIYASVTGLGAFLAQNFFTQVGAGDNKLVGGVIEAFLGTYVTMSIVLIVIAIVALIARKIVKKILAKKQA